MRTALGGIASVLHVQGLTLPHTDKVIKLQLRGLERAEPPKQAGNVIIPSDWLPLWLNNRLLEAGDSDLSMFFSIVLHQYFGWRAGTVLRTKCSQVRLLDSGALHVQTAHFKN